jgi:predicted phage terminase large subunit-like protein
VYLAQKLIEAITAGNKRIIITAPPRHGKLCADSTPVLTPLGWRTHGELEPGDFVFGPDGLPAKVLAVSKRARSNKRVTLTNGETIACHENHEWTVYDRNKKKMRTVETKELLPRKDGRCIHQLPLVKPLVFEEAELPMAPYVLGAWLGDGSTGRPHMTHTDLKQPVIDEIARFYPVSTGWVHKDTGVTTTSFAGDGGRNSPSSMSRDLATIGVLGEKQIPDAYLRGSIDQRLQLLAGLVDTDGHVEKPTGRVRYVTTSEAIRDGVYDLASTLGFRPYITQQEPAVSSSGIVGRKVVYTVGFQPTMQIPTLVPKKTILRFAAQRRVGVVSVEPVENPEQGHCIQVDREDGLYLVGRTMVPTHNSELTSRWLPTWYLDMFPTKRVILASYASKLATRWCAQVRDAFDGSNPHVWAQLDPNNASKDEWYLKEGGGMKAVGVGGGITGFGGDVILVDDPIKDWFEAQSATALQRVIDWFNGTLYHRLEPAATIILIQTRWNEGDLAGFLMNEHEDDWVEIRMPAIAEENDALGREVGAALCPERYDEARLAKIKKAVGPQVWAGLFQQRPAPAEGNIIKRDWVQYYGGPTEIEVPEGARQFQSWDINGGGETAKGSHNVGQVWGDIQGAAYLLDQVRDGSPRWAFTETKKQLLRLSIRWPSARKKYVEKKAAGIPLISDMKTKIKGLIPVVPKGSKIARLEAVAGFFEAGDVWFPHPQDAPWVRELVEELVAFPNAAADDQVDTVTQALNQCKPGAGGVMQLNLDVGKGAPSWRFN